ncbi:unnamed protein product [Heligmosomoides polygyrus]|uniref:Reverse transcriptase domain-containing protein n=1 Tax=Heligmosomoides polygyrus TaxID=6339 RepID=A0A183F417_HELPZ|nr:unnamed protein product [Heligmosomoides polygyrus]
MMDRKTAVKRLNDYIEEISNAEFAHPAIPIASPVHGPVQKINVEETEAVSKKMRPGEATADRVFHAAGCGAIDTIHAVRLLLEKHREKQKPVHFAFLDMEKFFDRVP